MTVRATDILKAIQKLNPAEKHRLREYLINALTASSSTGTVLQEISERKNKSGYHCPDCESEHIVRFGKYSTIVDGEEVKKQRYRCKACKTTFTDLTNTALYRTRRLNQWIKFVECMIEGYSLRKSAELVGNVTHVTLFYWRHKPLSSLKSIYPTSKVSSKWTRPISCTQKKDKERLKTESPANVAVLQRNVE